MISVAPRISPMGGFVMKMALQILVLAIGIMSTPAFAQCEGVEVAKVFGSDSVHGDTFGFSCDVSSRFIAIGAPHHDDGANQDRGAVYILDQNGGPPFSETKLFGSPADAGDEFGFDVAIHEEWLAVGAHKASLGSARAGSVSTFKFDGSTWSETQILVDPSGSTDDRFGNALDCFT